MCDAVEEETTADAIRRECRSLEALLLGKNAAYGDSALKPLSVFSRAAPGDGIRIRLDDKLSRIARGDGSGDEDAGLDFIGYLILLRIAEGREARAAGDLNHEAHEGQDGRDRAKPRRRKEKTIFAQRCEDAEKGLIDA